MHIHAHTNKQINQCESTYRYSGRPCRNCKIFASTHACMSMPQLWMAKLYWPNPQHMLSTLIAGFFLLVNQIVRLKICEEQLLLSGQSCSAPERSFSDSCLFWSLNSSVLISESWMRFCFYPLLCLPCWPLPLLALLSFQKCLLFACSFFKREQNAIVMFTMQKKSFGVCLQCTHLCHSP